MGVAFENIDCTKELFPAITGKNIQINVNFGDQPFVFHPPDDGYGKLCDLL